MYQKITENGYILSVTNGVSNGNITEREYNAIITAVQNRPAPPSGFDYRLKEDLTWELYEQPVPEEVDDEISPDELMSMMEGIL